jgi:hypothetical protein
MHGAEEGKPTRPLRLAGFSCKVSREPPTHRRNGKDRIFHAEYRRKRIMTKTEKKGKDGKRTVLAVYCRRPEPGRVKTRLARTIGDESARGFYAGCLKSLRHDLHILGRAFDIAVCPSDRSDAEWAAGFFPAHDLVVPQIFGDLGRRLEHTDLTLRCHGYDRVVLVGSDAPTLPLGYLSDIDEQFKRADVVLGPCADGGVYAIGLRVSLLAVQDIPWGTEAVFTRLKGRFEERGTRVGTLPTWYDVDRVDDLVRAHGDLLHSPLRHRRDLGALIEGILSDGAEDDAGGASLPYTDDPSGLMHRDGGEE